MNKLVEIERRSKLNRKLLQNSVLGLTLLVIGILLVGCDGVTHNLSVQRYTTSSLTNAQADSILASASTVIKTNDGTGDVACDVTFTRNGNVTAFTTGDGSIDSQAEFNTILALSGFVAVVNQINWCGGLIPNVIGCAPVPGNSLVVVRFTSSQEGILWAHEFGHTRGLGHRNGDPNAVMNGTIGPTRLRITSDECTAFRTAVTSSATSAARAMSAQDFVRQVFIHGVPYEEASSYDAMDVPNLLEMLNDPEEMEHWANIVVVLNIIGDESVLDPLIAFITDGLNGELDHTRYVATTSAIMSMGYLINRTGDERALNFLIESLNPRAWEDRNATGVSPFLASVAETNQDLSKYAILGLALSGNPEAATALRTFLEAEPVAGAEDFQAQVQDVVTEALDANQSIEQIGLVEYYRTQER